MTDSEPAGDAVPGDEALGAAADPDLPARPATWGSADSFNSLLPVVAFVALNSLLGLSWAIVGTTIASLYAMWHRYRRGLGIGLFVPVVAIVLVIRAAIGIATGSEDVYFGTGIAVKFLLVLGLAGSVAVGRNAVGYMAPYVLPLPASTMRHGLYRSTTAGLTLIWAAYLLVSGLFDVWLLSAASANQFVVVRFLVSWPLSSATVAGAMVWASRRFNRIPGFPGLLVLLDEQFGGGVGKRVT